MQLARKTALFLCLAAAGFGLACSASLHAQDLGTNTLSGRLLEAHNRERVRIGQSALVWNSALADQAASWARNLARRETLEHSQTSERHGEGENLWMGTTDAYSPEEMIDAFVSEKEDFRPGIFPNVANGKDWTGIGHYTQLIWPSTREVGCALARGANYDVLVCRYWPAGNIIGARVP